MGETVGARGTEPVAALELVANLWAAQFLGH